MPTIEIARVMSDFRNSLLKYNPRSYLEFEGERVNSAIRDTLVNRSSNEFALLNNGITIISDETNINEKFGKKNKAQLHLLNPQIINGGQTAYTLSRVYDSTPAPDRERLFEGKEVLAKVITVIGGENDNASARQILIERISTATNSQTVVTAADRVSNDPVHLRLQKVLFERYGLLYERKRGEFNDGVRSGYIRKDHIIDRNIFFRVYLTVQGKLTAAGRRRVFAKEKLDDTAADDLILLDRFAYGYFVFRFFLGRRHVTNRRFRAILARVFAANFKFVPTEITEIPAEALKSAAQIDSLWPKFLAFASERNKRWTKVVVDDEGNQIKEMREDPWLLSESFARDATDFFSNVSAACVRQ